MIIILEQREFGKAKEVVSSVLRGADNIRLRLSSRAKDSASKEVAKSLDKDFAKKKIKEIKENYKNKPEIAKRKIEEVKKHSRGRRVEYERGARGKFEAMKPADPKTAEQIEATAEKIVNPKLPTVEQVKDKTLKAGRSVLEGAKKTYTDTGRLITSGTAKLVENPSFEVAMRAGDVWNAGAFATGNPAAATFPMGGALVVPLSKAQKAVLGRKGNRKLRQTAIKIRKSKLSNWSLKKQAQEAQQYSRHLGVGGRINYSTV